MFGEGVKPSRVDELTGPGCTRIRIGRIRVSAAFRPDNGVDEAHVVFVPRCDNFRGDGFQHSMALDAEPLSGGSDRSYLGIRDDSRHQSIIDLGAPAAPGIIRRAADWFAPAAKPEFAARAASVSGYSALCALLVSLLNDCWQS